MGGSPYRLPVFNASCPGKQTGHKLSAGGHFLVCNNFCPQGADPLSPGIRRRTAAAVFGRGLQHQTQPFVGKIVFQRLIKLLPGKPVFPFDPLLHCSEGIRNHGKRRTVYADGEELGALGRIQPLLQTMMKHQIHDQLRRHLMDMV